MGLIATLLTFPVSLPLKGAQWGVNKVAEQAELLYYDEDSIRRQLLELEMRFEFGDISEQEFEDAEQRLLDRLEEGRARHAEGDLPEPDSDATPLT